MPRSDEAEFWINAVYAAVQEIPLGKVTSYGHIALLLGQRMSPYLSTSISPPHNQHPISIPTTYTPRTEKVTRRTAQRPRQVGTSLKHLPSDPTQHFNSSNVPWQRVINAKGMISHREPGDAERQAEVLREEGVEVGTDSMGEFYIDMGRYGWFPAQLPSEEGLDDDDDGDDNRQ